MTAENASVRVTIGIEPSNICEMSYRSPFGPKFVLLLIQVAVPTANDE
jgi:hypothetical protein